MLGVAACLTAASLATGCGSEDANSTQKFEKPAGANPTDVAVPRRDHEVDGFVKGNRPRR